MNDLFQYYPVWKHHEINKYLKRIEIKEKEILKKPEELCIGFPLLVEGTLRITQMMEDGEEVFLYDLHPGDYCHEVMNCLIKKQNGWIKSMAITDCTMYLIPADVFVKELKKDDTLLMEMYMDALEKLHLMMYHNEIKNLGVEQRLLQYLIQQKSNIIYTTHKDIALQLYSAREVISRKLKEYEGYGWLSLSKGKIVIKQRHVLEEEYRKVGR